MEGGLAVVEDLDAAAEVVGEVFGWRDAYYAREAALAAGGEGGLAGVVGVPPAEDLAYNLSRGVKVLDDGEPAFQALAPAPTGLPPAPRPPQAVFTTFVATSQLLYLLLHSQDTNTTPSSPLYSGSMVTRLQPSLAAYLRGSLLHGQKLCLTL